MTLKHLLAGKPRWTLGTNGAAQVTILLTVGFVYVGLYRQLG